MAALDASAAAEAAGPGADLAAAVRQLTITDKPSVAAAVLDRDSAVHSPSDFLNGPVHSDTNSVSSNDNDSGKGGSDCLGRGIDVMTPPLSPVAPHDVLNDASSSASSTSTSAAEHGHQHLGDELQRGLAPLPERLFVYEFEILQTLCGLLIGRFGAFVNQIRVKTGASLIIKKHPTNKRHKLCAIEGTKAEIDAALELLREKFPPKRYPHVTLEQTNIPASVVGLAGVAPGAVPVLPDSIQLHLPAEVTCDVVVSAVVAPNHVFVQQVTHPTYPSLARLDLCMAMCYNEFETPHLPQPIQPSMVCAAPSAGGWYRAKVIAVHPPTPADAAAAAAYIIPLDAQGRKEPAAEEELATATEEEEVDICYVDYGGYARVPASSLRQIRADFMTLPFQAVECVLANITPLSEEEGWSVEAYAHVETMTSDRLLQSQVVAYSHEGLPLVYLYQIAPMDAAGDAADAGDALLNRQLVARGAALWVEPQVQAAPDQ